MSKRYFRPPLFAEGLIIGTILMISLEIIAFDKASEAMHRLHNHPPSHKVEEFHQDPSGGGGSGLPEVLVVGAVYKEVDGSYYHRRL